MLVFSLYTMVDGFFVANFVGEHALASVNLSMPFVNTLFAIAIIFAVGTQTIIGVLLGQKKLEEAKCTFSFTVVVITIFAAILAIVCAFNVEHIARFLGASDDLLPLVMDYIRIIVLFAPFFIISYNFEVLVKVDGFPRTATLGVFASAITNIVLDYLFVAVFHWGIKGAAWATGISQVLSTVIFILHFTFGKATLRFVSFKPDFSIFKKIIPLGFGDFISEIGIGVIVFFYNIFLMKSLGEESIATFSVISYVNQLVCMCFVGITQGIQPLVSYYYGSEEPENYKKLFRYSLVSVGVVSVVAVVVSYLFGENIFLMFFDKTDTVLISESVIALKKFAPSFLFVGFNLLIAGFSSSLLRANYSITINILRSFILIVCALFFTTNILGPNYIWFSSILAEGVCLIVSTVFLARISSSVYKK